MVLSPLVFLLVLFAAFGHASWNALVKAGRDPLVSLTYVICVPGFLCGLGLFFLPLPDPGPRPIRLDGRRLPLAGDNSCSFMTTPR